MKCSVKNILLHTIVIHQQEKFSQSSNNDRFLYRILFEQKAHKTLFCNILVSKLKLLKHVQNTNLPYFHPQDVSQWFY